MSSNLFGDLGGKLAPAPAPAPENPADSELIQQIPENADHLTDERLASALDTSLQATKNNNITLDFREGGVHHFNDGCNSGTAKYQLDNTGALHLSYFTDTKMACEPGAQKDADDLKMVLQSNPQLFQLDASTLFLFRSGASALSFRRCTAATTNNALELRRRDNRRPQVADVAWGFHWRGVLRQRPRTAPSVRS